MCNEEQEIPQKKGENGLEELAECQYDTIVFGLILIRKIFRNKRKSRGCISVLSHWYEGEMYVSGVRPSQVHEITSRG